jgi:transmembrane sensor
MSANLPDLSLLERAATLIDAVHAGRAGAEPALAAFLDVSVEHRLAYAEALAAWHAVAAFTVADAAAPAVAHHERGTPQARRVTRRGHARTRWSLAAAALLALGFALHAFMPTLRADYATPFGASRKLTLEDGSVLELAPDTQIAVRYEAQARRVELLHGELFATVKPDAARPFSIVAGELEAVAVGTRYGVSRWAGEAVTVTMEEGVVEARVQGRAAPQRLVAGERFDAEAQTLLDDAGDALAWRRGYVVLRSQRLDAALATLDRYVPGRIVCVGACDARVSGVLPIADAASAVRSLAERRGYSVHVGPYLTVVAP